VLGTVWFPKTFPRQNTKSTFFMCCSRRKSPRSDDGSHPAPRTMVNNTASMFQSHWREVTRRDRHAQIPRNRQAVLFEPLIALQPVTMVPRWRCGPCDLGLRLGLTGAGR
jgi:hypothetical protein